MKGETECERVLAYMSRRYGDSFTCPVYYGGYPGAPVHQYYLKAEGLGDAPVRAEIRRQGSGRERILDNYMAVVFEPRLKEVVEDLLRDSLFLGRGQVCLMMDPTALGLSDHWTRDTAFEEYCADPAAGIYFRGVMALERDFGDPETRRITEQLLEEGLTEAGICCTGWLYFVSEEVDLTDLSEDNFYERIVQDRHYAARLFFNMRTAAEVDAFSWEGEGIGIPEPREDTWEEEELEEYEIFLEEPGLTAADCHG